MPKIKIPAITVICFVTPVFIKPTVTLGLILLPVLLHEAGHVFVMLCLKTEIEQLTLLPFGIDIKRRDKFISYPKEAAIALAGPSVNILVFFIFAEYRFFAYINLLYALINLIPVKGLDGGNALEAFLLSRWDFAIIQRVMKTLSFVFLILLWILGVYILFILEGNISIFALSLFLFVTVIMK